MADIMCVSVESQVSLGLLLFLIVNLVLIFRIQQVVKHELVVFVDIMAVAIL